MAEPARASRSPDARQPLRARPAIGFAVVLLALAAEPGCGRRTSRAPALAITPQADVQPSRVPAGGAVSIEYRWTVGASAPRITRPYRVFVHFLDRHGTLLFADAHEPSPPVVEWQPGHSYAYRRTTLTLEFPYVGPLTVVMGLYSQATGERLPLSGQDAGQRRYRVAALSLLPRDRELSLRCEGLYPPETPVAAPLLVTRFMRREATCRFRNPREDTLVFVQGDLEPAAFTTAPILSLSSLAATARHELPLTDELQLLQFRIPARDLGREAEATLRLGMSASYFPRLLGGSDDPREVSLRLFRLLVLRAGGVDPILREGAIPLLRPQS